MWDEESELLGSTYTETCTVFRRMKTKTVDGETVFIDNNKVYESIPCGLSYGSTSKINQSTSVASATKDCSLFVYPDVEILPNDTIEVERLGKKIVFLAGESEDHPSHSQVMLSKKVNEV